MPLTTINPQERKRWHSLMPERIFFKLVQKQRLAGVYLLPFYIKGGHIFLGNAKGK